jgi:hypothetical protein
MCSKSRSPTRRRTRRCRGSGRRQARRRRVVPRRRLAFLLALCAGCFASPEQTQIVFDYNHDNRHRIFDGNQSYRALYELLEAEGYSIELWENSPFEQWVSLVGCPAPTCDPPIPRAEIDVFVEAMPQVLFGNGFFLAWLEQWVTEGGVLFLITDHFPFAGQINLLAGMFDVRFQDTNSIVGDGATHCPPGVELCLPGRISFLESELASLFAGSVEFVTTYAGTSVFPTDAGVDWQPILRLGEGFTTQISGEPRDGEVTLAFVRHGEGAVILASEAGMWSCGESPEFSIGWCDSNPIDDGVYNDRFVLNLFEYFRVLYVSPDFPEALRHVVGRAPGLRNLPAVGADRDRRVRRVRTR